MSRAYKQFSFRPADGGRLAADISAQEVGVANHRTKRDWRRYLDRDKRREGHDYFEFDPLKSLNADGPILLVFNCTSANGTKAVIAGTATTLYRYFSLFEGGYVAAVDPFFYFDRNDLHYPYVQTSGPSTPYVLEDEDASTYFDLDDPYYPYVDDTFSGWTVIGSGFSPLGDRWEARQVGDDIIFNNGVDLPQVYSLSEFQVTPLYELRENGIASVGTIAEFNSILLAADIAQIREDQFASVFNPIRMAGNAYQTGAQYSLYPGDTGLAIPPDVYATLANQPLKHDSLSRLCSITAGSTTLNFTYATGIWPAGTALQVLGAGTGGAALEAAIVSLAGDNLSAVLDVAAVTTVTDGFVSGPDLASVDAEKFVTIDTATGDFRFTADMEGKRLRFRNGFEREIIDYVSPTQVELAAPYPLFAVGVDEPAREQLVATNPEWADMVFQDYLGNLEQTFWIVSAGNVDRIVISDNPVFTADMVGLHLYWDDGNTRLITALLSSTQVEVADDFPIPNGPFAIENRMTYGPITDGLKLDRIRYRVIWSALGAARRFAAKIPASIVAGSFTLQLDYPVKSFYSGLEIIVLGAGPSGGNLVATILSVTEGSKAVMLSVAASTTIAATLVSATDMIGSIAGLQDDLDQDGTAVIRMLELNDRLVLYREQGYMIGDYNPSFDEAGNVLSAFSFTKQIKTSNVLHYKHSLINVTFKGNNLHLFAGQKDIFRFDMISRLPVEFEPMQLCRSIFFKEAEKGEVQIPNGPNVAAGLSYDTLGGYATIPLEVGKTYFYQAGPNETSASMALAPIPSGTTFVATYFNMSVSGSGAVTAQVYIPSSTRSVQNFTFSADNTLTKEIFLCFPSDSADKALIFDYDQGTVSTTGAAYTAGCSVYKPGGEALIFTTGTMEGQVLYYGLFSENIAAWGGKTAMYNRLGQPYDSELYSGLGGFGIGMDERVINGYVFQLSSFSADVNVTVSLYGAKNPNAPEKLLATKTFSQPSAKNLFPVYFMAYYFADKIVVSGKDNPCEVSVRSYSIAGVRSESVTRGRS